MENHTYKEEFKHSLIEMMAFTKPKGLENYRFYRIEYGGHAMDCVHEGAIWLPENVDREEIEKLINMEKDDDIKKDDDITSLRSEIELRKRDRKLLHDEYEKALDEIVSLKDEIKRKDKALKLSEEDRQKIIDNSHRSLRLHKSRAQGQMLTESDTIEAHVIFETLAYIKSRPIEEVSDGNI